MQVSTCWTEELPLPLTLQILESLALDHSIEGGPRGAEIADLIRSRNYRDLVNFNLDYKEDWQVSQLTAVRQVLAFFQKLEDLDIGVDKTSVARAKFWQAEESCRETNNVLRAYVAGKLCLLPAGVRLLETARRKIHKVLGRCPSLEGLRFHFGPGATTVTKRTDAVPQQKFAAGLQCSSSMFASGLLPSILRQVPHWVSNFEDDWHIDDDNYLASLVEVDVVPGRLTFVPKSAKTYRTIMVEPNLNGFVQQGIRHALETRLKLVGLDVADQSRNARLARRGSLDGSLATLDLSSASDLISRELVKLLLPEDWYSLLSAARTGYVEDGDDCEALEKFSSMGNAYTFPLETLIFWAIATASPLCFGEAAFDPDDVGVFGDDIIIPARGYKAVKFGLEFCGFSINTEKSFYDGPFRESCGADYYKGIDIRPYYQKHLVSGRTLFTLHNFYRRCFDDRRAEAVRSMIPRELRIYGPDGYGDGHLISERWPSNLPAKLRSKGYGGRCFTTYTLGRIRKVSRYPGDYVTPLYTIYMKDSVRIHDLVPVSESTACEFRKDGRPLWTYPGSEGYKRVSIYTLA